MALQTKTFSVGSTTSSALNYYAVELVLSEDSTSAANNSSEVTYKLQIRSGNTAFSLYGIGAEVKLAGNVVASRDRYNEPQLSLDRNSTLILLSGTATVAHNADGTLDMAVAFSVDMATGSYVPGPVSVAGQMTLTAIPRATTPTASAASVEMGSSMTITANPASSSFTHTLRYAFGSTTGTIASKTAIRSVAWTPSLALASQIPNSPSGLCTIYCDTYSGDALIGTTPISITLIVPASVAPTIDSVTAELVDSSGMGVWIQGFCAAKLTVVGAAGAYGSSIKSYKIAGGGYTGTVNPYTTGTINTGDDIVFTATVTDSRGRTASASVSVTVLAYSPPQITSLDVFRCDSTGAKSSNGTYAAVTPAVSYSAVGTNALTITAAYKLRSATSYGTAVVINNNALNVIGNGELSTANSYVIHVTVADAFYERTADYPIGTAFKIISFLKNLGVAIGKVAELAGWCEINMHTRVNGMLTAASGTLVDNLHYGAKDSELYGVAGYAHIATIQITGTYANAPICIEIAQRGHQMSTTLYIRFENSSDMDPTLNSFVYTGAAATAYIYQSGVGVWELYALKTGAYDDIGVLRCHIPPYMRDRIQLAFNPLGSVTDLPEGAVAATAA